MQMACKSVIASDSLSISLSIIPSSPPLSLSVSNFARCFLYFARFSHRHALSYRLESFRDSPLYLALFPSIHFPFVCMEFFFHAHFRSSICLTSVSGARYNRWKWPALWCYLNLFSRPCSKPINYFKLYYRLTHPPWYISHHPCSTHFFSSTLLPPTLPASISFFLPFHISCTRPLLCLIFLWYQPNEMNMIMMVIQQCFSRGFSMCKGLFLISR